jgi:hypothetical protein
MKKQGISGCIFVIQVAAIDGFTGDYKGSGRTRSLKCCILIKNESPWWGFLNTFTAKLLMVFNRIKDHISKRVSRKSG